MQASGADGRGARATHIGLARYSLSGDEDCVAEDELRPHRGRERTGMVEGLNRHAGLMSDPRWFDDVQQQEWRSYVQGSALLVELRERELRRRRSVSLADFEILLGLS